MAQTIDRCVGHLLDDSTDNFRTKSLFETLFAKIIGGII